MPPPRNRTRYISRIVAAFLITLSGTRLRKKCAESFFAEHGQSGRKQNCDGSCLHTAGCGTRRTTDQHQDDHKHQSGFCKQSQICSVKSCCSWRYRLEQGGPDPFSQRQTGKFTEKEVNSRNCNQNSSNSQNNFTLHIIFFKLQFIFLISAQVTKPTPPVTIKAMIVKFTRGFEA